METTDLYGGAVKLCFDPKKHLYTVDGVPVDGVTSALGVIAKPALVPWAVKMTAEAIERAWQPGKAYDELEVARAIADAKRAHREKTSDAAAIGTMVHKWAEEYLLSDHEPAMPINVQARNGAQAFLSWVDQHEVGTLYSERKIYSRAYNYAGTCDLIAIIDGRLTVADFKTSSGLYSEMRYQLSAYKAALVEEGIVPADAGRAVIRFDKRDGSFEFHRLPDEDDEEDFNAFLSALMLHRRQKAHEFRNRKSNAA